LADSEAATGRKLSTILAPPNAVRTKRYLGLAESAEAVPGPTSLDPAKPPRSEPTPFKNVRRVELVIER
jgi:hypothetical protein